MKELKTATTGTTQAGRRISKVAAECVVLSDELVKLLEDVRGAGRRKPLGSVNATIKALRGNKRIEKLRKAVKEKQALLDTALTHDIR